MVTGQDNPYNIFPVIFVDTPDLRLQLEWPE